MIWNQAVIPLLSAFVMGCTRAYILQGRNPSFLFMIGLLMKVSQRCNPWLVSRSDPVPLFYFSRFYTQSRYILFDYYPVDYEKRLVFALCCCIRARWHLKTIVITLSQWKSPGTRSISLKVSDRRRFPLVSVSESDSWLNSLSESLW